MARRRSSSAVAAPAAVALDTETVKGKLLASLDKMSEAANLALKHSPAYMVDQALAHAASPLYEVLKSLGWQPEED